MATDTPPSKKNRRGLAVAAATILALIVVIFLGYNLWYLALAQ